MKEVIEVLVLSDEEISSILENLSLPEAHSFRQSMESALYGLSNSTAPECPQNDNAGQPLRTSLVSPYTGATTLFMPSATNRAMAVKVVTLLAPGATKPPSSTLSSIDGSNDTDTAGTTTTRPTGAITLFTPHGEPLALVHARTLTAFRTALASSSLVVRRRRVANIVVFGCGEQAYWHLRLALLFRGSRGDGSGDENGETVRSITIICRSRRHGELLAERLRHITDTSTLHKDSVRVLSHEDNNEDGNSNNSTSSGNGSGTINAATQKALSTADVVFTTTPSTSPLFTIDNAFPAAPLVVAIGSYRHDMHELPEALLLRALDAAPSSGAGRVGIVVDTAPGALMEAGEIISAGLREDQLVELGRLFGGDRGLALSARIFGGGEHVTAGTQADRAGQDVTSSWLAESMVVHKSVGVGVMDLAASLHLVDLVKRTKT